MPFANALADAGHRTLLLDDEGSDAPIRADVLNQNLHGTAAMYPAARGRVLAGVHFAMLRRELLTRRRRPLAPVPIVRSALVTFGGADPQRLTGVAARLLRDAGVERVVAVIGASAPVPDAPGVEVHVNPPDFFGLVAGVGLALTAAGSTVWELAWLGVPMALVSTAPNQEPVLAAAALEGLAIGFGNAKAFRDGPRDRLAALLDDPQARLALARRGRALVDGGGAARVVEQFAPG